MTLIKKIKQVHAGATTTNLLAMALMMSAIGCGCGDDEKEGGEGVDFELTAAEVKPKDSGNIKDVTIKVDVKVKAGTLKPEDWKINIKDVVVKKHDGTASAETITWKQEGKNLKEAGLTAEVKKDASGSFNLESSITKKYASTGDPATVTANLIVTGKGKDGKDKESKAILKITAEA
jgi:hypothetical protein